VAQGIGAASASINGSVRDASGAVIPQATVQLKNVQTSVTWTVATNAVGDYAILNIPPGTYTLLVSKQGFAPAEQAKFTLFVNQTGTFDFALRVGSSQQAVTVEGTAVSLETSTAELGTVIGGQQVDNLPLNGRNFTQLLTLTAGVSPLNTDQNSGGWTASPIGDFTFPAVNGQPNRSNMFLVDGVDDYSSFVSTYTVAPIIDDIQEFKIQSGNDEAQFGGVSGGIVNVVTKSGTNRFHGNAWDFLRNNDLDSRNFFNSSVTPLKWNQFGATLGGPIIIPRLYNGRNKTFFFAAYEGVRISSASSVLFITPNATELTGDLTDLGTQIYNPFTTDPNTLARDPFMCDAAGNPLPTGVVGTPCSKIPSSLLDPKMVLLAKTVFPTPINTGFAGYDGLDTTPNATRQDEGTLRLDEVIGNNDRVSARLILMAQKRSGSGGFTGLKEDEVLHNYNLAASWSHSFGSSAVLTLALGRTAANDDETSKYTNVNSENLVNEVGFTPFLVDISGRYLIPSIGIPGFGVGGLGEIVTNPKPQIWQGKADFVKVHNKQTIKAGLDIATNAFIFPCLFGGVGFDPFQTSDLLTSTGGAGLASFLLGVPNGAGYGNAPLHDTGGFVDGFYIQDQWKVTPRLTLNVGLRYDLPLHSYGGDPATHTDEDVANWDFNTGNYVLQKTPPSCAVQPYAPCIPGGVLPAHVIANPRPGRSLLDNAEDNLGPRLGLAYRINSKTAGRASYGRFFDTWASVTQNQLNFDFAWPSENILGTPPLNQTVPTVTAEAPFGPGQFVLPSPTPYFNQVHFADPKAKDALSEQWHLQIERQLSNDTMLAVAYVGSHTIRIPVFFADNAPPPGPGNTMVNAPFPYTVPQPYYRTIGKASYNALQVTLDKKSIGGMTYLVTYTYSKIMNFGCDGNFANCGVQDPNHWQDDRGVGGFDQTHRLGVSWVYPLPFGKKRRWLGGGGILGKVAGDWQINGIGSLASGQPYSVTGDNSIPNIGIGNNERPNLVGNSFAGATLLQPLNADAFQEPAPYTFGNLGRNTYRSDYFRNLDLSIFREFPISEATKLQFRWEAFNLSNTPVFGVPDTSILDETFGQVSSTNNTERRMQFALKLYF
jgi:hypothetical protein